MMNLYARFNDLTNRSLRTVGTCIDAIWGECTIQYPGGKTVKVIGAGTTGLKYFIIDGRLDGQAPNLDYLEIDL